MLMRCCWCGNFCGWGDWKFISLLLFWIFLLFFGWDWMRGDWYFYWFDCVVWVDCEVNNEMWNGSFDFWFVCIIRWIEVMIELFKNLRLWYFFDVCVWLCGVWFFFGLIDVCKRFWVGGIVLCWFWLGEMCLCWEF